MCVRERVCTTLQLMLLRLTTASAHRLLSRHPRPGGPWRRSLLLPSKAMGDTSKIDAAASSLASAKAALRREVKAKLMAVPDEVLAEECACLGGEGGNGR